MRKPRGILYNITTKQKAALERWLMDDCPKLTYMEAVERLATEFKVEVSNRAVAVFYQRAARRRMLERLEVSRHATQAVTTRSRERRGEAFEAFLELSGHAAFALHTAAENSITLKDLNEMVAMAARGLRTRNETDSVAIRGRGMALRERKYEDVLEANKPKLAPTGEEMEMIAARLRI